jgi:hypothetical protein
MMRFELLLQCFAAAVGSKPIPELISRWLIGSIITFAISHVPPSEGY